MDETAFRQWFGQRLQSARQQHGLTQNALARMLPPTVTPGAVGSWERGEVYPRAENVAAIIAALNTTPEHLFCGLLND